VNKAHSELIVLVTPELVSPIPAGKPVPDLTRPLKFLDDKGTLSSPPRTPGEEVTGAVPKPAKRNEISVQELESIEKQQQTAAPATPSPTLAGPMNVTGPLDVPVTGTTPAARPPK